MSNEDEQFSAALVRRAVNEAIAEREQDLQKIADEAATFTAEEREYLGLDD